MAGLALRRCYEGLQSGRSAVSVRDVAALLKLQREIERDDALASRDAAMRQVEQWQRGLWIIRNAIVRQHGEAAWARISAEIQRDRETTRKIREARQRFRGGGLGSSPGFHRPVEGATDNWTEQYVGR